MKKIILFITIVMVIIGCSKNEIQPVVTKPTIPKQYSDKDLIGNWKLENNGVTISFDIVSDPYHKISDTIYLRHAIITYNSVTSTPPDTVANKSSTFKINKTNEGYNIVFGSEVINGNYTGANTTQFFSCKVNSDYTELAPIAGNYPDGSWTSLVGYIDANFLIVNFSSPVVITKTK